MHCSRGFVNRVLRSKDEMQSKTKLLFSLAYPMEVGTLHSINPTSSHGYTAKTKKINKIEK